MPLSPRANIRAVAGALFVLVMIAVAAYGLLLWMVGPFLLGGP